MTVLVNHPSFGSLYLTDCEIKDGFVEGFAWDDSGASSPYMPDDYLGERIVMNFPVTCIRKVVDANAGGTL